MCISFSFDRISTAIFGSSFVYNASYVHGSHNLSLANHNIFNLNNATDIAILYHLFNADPTFITQTKCSSVCN